MRRRSTFAALLWLASGRAALAQVRVNGGSYTPDNSPPVATEAMLTLGQSWSTNEFCCISTFALNPQKQTLLDGEVIAFNGTSFVRAPMFAGVGIARQPIVGITGYGPPLNNISTADNITLGRVMVMMLQLIRVQKGLVPVRPILELNFGFPGSSWNYGGGGGLAPGAHITASVVNDVLIVSGVSDGFVSVNQVLPDVVGLDSRTVITELAGGSGGTGNYNIAIGQISITVPMTTPGAAFTGDISNENAEPGNICNVRTMTSGAISIGETLSGAPVLAGTVFVSQLSGTTGGVGRYRVRVGAAQSVVSKAMFAQSVTWRNMLLGIGEVAAILPTSKMLAPVYKSFLWTQGSGSDGTVNGKVADLGDMFVKIDAANLPGAASNSMIGYIMLPAAIAEATTVDVSSTQGTYNFTRTNAPGRAGAYSGRCFLVGPSYPYPFNIVDDIHTGPYGTKRWGAMAGYVKHLVEDVGVPWTPLWRPLTGGAITRNGQVISIPFARPAGPDFANGTLQWKSDPTDGIKVWPQMGIQIKRGGSFLTVSPAINGMQIDCTVTEALSPGQTFDVSYAWFGPGGVVANNSTGVGGNLCMAGPADLTTPGSNLCAWAAAFLETVTLA